MQYWCYGLMCIRDRLVLSADMQKMAIGVTDMQKVIVKMATNQQQMAERVSMWPYIKIDPNQKRKS